MRKKKKKDFQISHNMRGKKEVVYVCKRANSPTIYINPKCMHLTKELQKYIKQKLTELKGETEKTHDYLERSTLLS